MATMEKDFQPGPWWSTTDLTSWADDKDRHRSGTLTYSGTTHGEVDMYEHSGDNQPTDVYHGKRDGHSGLELDAAKINAL